MVLIVAKCIVNMIENRTVGVFLSVLIVAKCIVNLEISGAEILIRDVLIVAKCIVNRSRIACFLSKSYSINSSKVYIVNEETKGFETQNIDESEIILARGNEITFKKIELSRTHIVIEAEIGKVK